MARIGQPARKSAVIGKQQQAFGIVIESARGIDARRQPEFGQGAPRRRGTIGELAEHAIGLVEGDQHQRGSAPKPRSKAR
jgi:hypothetical protein